MGVNVGLSLTLFVILGAVGIAIATSIAGWLQVALLAGTLKSRGEFALDAAFRRRCPRICAASLAMGAVVWTMARILNSWFAPENGLIVQATALAFLVGIGLAVYALTAQALGAVELKPVLKSVLGR
jgi:putative peptidoglycan lipid II flippase